MDRTIKITLGNDIYEFKEDEHSHWLNGSALVGTTTVLGQTLAKPSLKDWSMNMALKYIKEHTQKDSTGSHIVSLDALKKARNASNEIMEYGKKWGTRVHNACEHWVKTNELPKSPDDNDILQSVINFQKFINDNGFRVVACEKPVWSKEWWVGGILDLILERNNKFYLADIKTTSGIYDDQFIQMGSYYKGLLETGMLKEYGIEKLDGMIIINLMKDGKIQHSLSRSVDSILECFSGVMSVNRNRKPLETAIKNVKSGTHFDD